MKNWLVFSIFMVVVLSISALSISYRDISEYTASCSCLNNECNLTGFALALHEDYCSKHISISVNEPIFSYTIVPNVTCSIARDCFYDSTLLGCKDMYDIDECVVGYCCYDNCKVLQMGYDFCNERRVG